MSIFEAIINFFKSIFGGNKKAQPVEKQEPVESVYPIKTDKQMFYDYFVREESAEMKDKLWNEAVANEQAGTYVYKLTGDIGYYAIDNGQLVGNGSVMKVVSSNAGNVEGTNMRKNVFNVMVSGERGDEEVIASVKKQMQEKDAIGAYPYTITTNLWMYTITKPAEPYFSMYGTQYVAVMKHK